ncbi:hypothetical protein FDP41_003612 [Naegleria fowleri]|uniref:Uncharacterized protein n=1 Tax=Naegleria fowleri TaxID=5763 RepID=A0A6A5BV57_NAEFO|nr:uncharacterized protein FDP41_003612 [Naegleria fowleri]KAF0977620.1 hypothetical protein FDP41_003612 [Naegleria fowleri]CAG4716422.1 unnamed protein product [Naegleria fowleri]
MTSADSEFVSHDQPQATESLPFEQKQQQPHIIDESNTSMLSLVTYKDQYIQIIQKAASSLYEQYKEMIHRVVGSVPKQKTKFKYWYGKYGGPFTWKDLGDPIDDLDLACFMHDKFLPLSDVRQLTKLMREFYGSEMSKQAIAYTRKIEGKAFGIIEPTYMKIFGKM